MFIFSDIGFAQLSFLSAKSAADFPIEFKDLSYLLEDLWSEQVYRMTDLCVYGLF